MSFSIGDGGIKYEAECNVHFLGKLPKKWAKLALLCRLFGFDWLCFGFVFLASTEEKLALFGKKPCFWLKTYPEDPPAETTRRIHHAQPVGGDLFFCGSRDHGFVMFGDLGGVVLCEVIVALVRFNYSINMVFMSSTIYIFITYYEKSGVKWRSPNDQ